MSFSTLIKSIFAYTPEKEYNFSLSQDEQLQNEDYNSSINSSEEFKKIFSSLNINLEYMKIKYNVLINSDIVLREFTLNARGKQYNAFILYIDGMVDSEIMDKFVLEPLIMRNRSNLFEGNQNKVISEAVANNITVRKVKKFDLGAYIMSCLIPQNSIKQVDKFEDVMSGINSRQLCFIYRYFKYRF